MRSDNYGFGQKRVNIGYKPQYPGISAGILSDLSLKSINYLIIEGNDTSNDYIVYSKIKKQGRCELRLGNTKNSILSAFKPKQYSNVFAIVDRDYDTIDNSIKNVFYTDYNDIECTAINLVDDSNQMRISLPIDRSISEEEFKEKVYLKALDLAKKISSINKYINKYNSQNNLNYKYIIRLFIDENPKK